MVSWRVWGGSPQLGQACQIGVCCRDGALPVGMRCGAFEGFIRKQMLYVMNFIFCQLTSGLLKSPLGIAACLLLTVPLVKWQPCSYSRMGPEMVAYVSALPSGVWSTLLCVFT